MILGDIVKAGLQVILILVVAYILLFATQGLGASPGDYPWEDVFPRPLSDVFYYFSESIEMWRTLFAY